MSYAVKMYDIAFLLSSCINFIIYFAKKIGLNSKTCRFKDYFKFVWNKDNDKEVLFSKLRPTNQSV